MEPTPPDAGHGFLFYPWLFGLLGGIVSLKGAPGANWRERAFNLVCAVIIAGTFTDGICDLFSIVSPSVRSMVAAGLGLFGLNLVAAIVEAIKAVKLLDYLPWPRRSNDGKGD